MKRLRMMNSFTPLAWVAFVVAALLVLALGIYLITEPQRARQAAAEARAGATIAGAGERASGAAVEAVAAQGERQAEREDLTRNNRDDILNAPGAKASVDPGVNDAGLRALCLREAFRRDPRCSAKARATSSYGS